MGGYAASFGSLDCSPRAAFTSTRDLGIDIAIETAGGGSIPPPSRKCSSARRSRVAARLKWPRRRWCRASLPYLSARNRCTSGRSCRSSDGWASHIRTCVDARSQRSFHVQRATSSGVPFIAQLTSVQHPGLSVKARTTTNPATAGRACQLQPVVRQRSRTARSRAGS